MAEPLMRKRIACPTLRVTKVLTREYITQLSHEHRHLVLKDPIKADRAAETLDTSVQMKKWWNCDLLEGGFGNGTKRQSGPERKLKQGNLDSVMTKTKQKKQSTCRMTMQQEEGERLMFLIEL